MLTTLWYRDGLHADPPSAQLPALLAEEGGLLWVDLEEPDEAEMALLERVFAFHPLALEDVRKRQQRPKVDRYRGYEFMVLYHVECAEEEQVVTRTQVGIFIGPNYVVTVHHAPVPPFREFQERWRAHPEMVEPHPSGFVIYHLLDGLVDALFPIADQIEQWLNQLEAEIFAASTPHTLERLLRLRESLIQLRHTASLERDVLNVLIRRDHPLFHETTAAFFNDVYDHLIRITETLDVQRDLLSGTLDAYLSLQSNRLNVVVKRLTGLTLVLMVITLVTGFFGMNVGFPGRDEPLGLLFAALGMLGLGIGAWALARSQDWL